MSTGKPILLENTAQSPYTIRLCTVVGGGGVEIRGFQKGQCLSLNLVYLVPCLPSENKGPLGQQAVVQCFHGNTNTFDWRDMALV